MSKQTWKGTLTLVKTIESFNLITVKMIKKICVLLSISLIFQGCTTNYNALSEGDTIIIEKIINELSGKEKIYASPDYVINPYLNTFRFHSFLMKDESSDYAKKKKIEIFKTLKIDKKGFEHIKKEANLKYSNGRYTQLMNLSNADSSNLVYTFSNLGENIVFVELRVLCDGRINKEGFINRDVLKSRERSELGSIAVIFDNEKIVKLIPINASTRECH